MSFNSDQAKITKEQDALGFTDSAESMAKSILNGKYPEGFVIGIDGDWGSGKTSFINFVCASLKEQYAEFLKEQSPEALKALPNEFTVIKFNPWLHSTQENLIAAYFKFLSESTKDTFGNDKAIKKAFANIIDITNITATAFAGFTPYGAVLPLVSMIMKWFSELLRKLPTLESQYDSIHKSFTKAKKPLLVIIDDLDRLDRAEIKTMLKLVKSVGKLPYVTYLLAYDRDYVENATKDDMPDRKTTFLQKIVQITFYIPKPDKNKLLVMLKNETTEFLKTIDENNKRWHDLRTAALNPYINKPRDVALLANAINFRFHAVKGKLDPVDFLAIECLCLFDKKLWDWIRDNREIILEGGEFSFLRHKKADFRNALEISLPVKLDELTRDQKTTLSVLFPNLADVFDGHEFSQTEFDYELQNRYGIAMSSVYDFYFSQYLDASEISKSDIDRFLENDSDKEKLTKELLNWIDKTDSDGNPKITEFLRKLSYRFMDKSSPNPDQTLLWVLSDAFKYTKELEESSLFNSIVPYDSIRYTFKMLFEKIGKQETNIFLQDLCKDEKRIFAAVYLLFWVGYYIGKTYKDERNNDPTDLIDEADWDALAESIKPHLKEVFLTGAVGDFANVNSAEFLAALIFDARQVRAMVRKACLESEPYVIKLIKAGLIRRMPADRFYRLKFNAKYTELFDYKFIAKEAEKIDLEKQDEETEEAITVFLEGVRNLNKKPPNKNGADQQD